MGGLFVRRQFVQRHYVHVFLSYIFLSNDFRSNYKEKSLVKETLTLNPIGQKDMDKVLLDELSSDKKSVHAVNRPGNNPPKQILIWIVESFLLINSSKKLNKFRSIISPYSS